MGIKIGAHVSAAGGLVKALERAKNIGADTIQIFGASPVQWKAPLPSSEEAKGFQSLAKKLEIGPVFLHAPYLINLASPKKNLAKISCELLKSHLEISNALGAEGVIFHIGSRGEGNEKEAEKMVIHGLKDILKNILSGKLLIENSAGAGNLVGDSLEEVGNIVRGVDNRRLGFCYDTAHGFESGVLVDFSKPSLDKFTGELEKLIGLEKWWAIHANDSKTLQKSNKDRHENIGEGYIGQEAFSNMLRHPEFKTRPFILEVPGFDDNGPDKKNIDILRNLI
ncbi:MAG: hypothetical protein UV58_C0006G0007 [Candidatus Wolfebacteria bacterium GW2011_GWC1_43_10]|uniref:Probable endonuclease 4 n=1 Tax=Candidatus Wolfebacteria bacterium GW2011_GWC1_43_10 TaxID=1619011 RepID=A0A0G1F783_9BACT|nr:MAG: hypothetical protein UV58_C0006G0007 [Candidatus Wolfebacteria bacterium GW2011_GWC1_43_10]KKT22913.1 MAG: putative endonuclease 4 [Parcubacteria group bacterium GW2011_GWB1_43_8b]